MTSSYRSGVIATILAAIIWSTGGLFIKLLPQSAYAILFYRSIYAAILFLVVFRSKVFKINRLTLIASFFYTILLISFVLATKLTTAANAIFLQYTAPAMVLLLEPIFFKIKLIKINVITVVISIVGMCLFFVDEFSGTFNWGIVYASISGFALAGLVISQRLNYQSAPESSIFLGNIWVVLIMLLFAQPDLSATEVEHSMLLFLGFIQIGVGYMLFTSGQKILSALESSLIALLEPILNPIWVVIGYGEYPSVYAIIGGLIIIAAITLRMVLLRSDETRHPPLSS